MSEIEITDDAGLRSIRLNRPEKKNALTRAMYGAMATALREAATEPGIRAVMITGGGFQGTWRTAGGSPLPRAGHAGGPW
jgi:enoyl-CoA hydratase/carnithine racemase